jgi:hypothetical protein
MDNQKSSKTYDFSRQESIGKYGEAIIDKFLASHYKILDVSDIRKYQETGIDRILMRPDGSMVNVEYKFDLASKRTGNIFFETVSVDTQNIPGWGWSSQADYWIFLIPEDEMLVVEPKKLRILVWQHRLNVVEKKGPNKNYKTLGVPIPLEQVRQIAHYMTNL